MLAASLEYARSADNKETIALVGGVEAILGALERHESDAAVAETSCDALFRLTPGTAARRVRRALGAQLTAALACPANVRMQIPRVSSVQPILGALRRHESNAAVSRAGCCAFALLAVNGGAERRTLSCALRAYCACCAADNQALIASGGCVEAIVSALRRHESDVDVAEAACATLFVLTISGACGPRVRWVAVSHVAPAEVCKPVVARCGAAALADALHLHEAVPTIAKYAADALAELRAGAEPQHSAD